MSHMIFELLVSSARIFAYTSASVGACAVTGSADKNKTHRTAPLARFTKPPDFATRVLAGRATHDNIRSHSHRDNRRPRTVSVWQEVSDQEGTGRQKFWRARRDLN